MARTLSIRFTMENDAFGEPDQEQWHDEASRILKAAAQRVENGADSFSLFDVNGNKVGSLDVID